MCGLTTIFSPCAAESLTLWQSQHERDSAPADSNRISCSGPKKLVAWLGNTIYILISGDPLKQYKPVPKLFGVLRRLVGGSHIVQSAPWASVG